MQGNISRRKEEGLDKFVSKPAFLSFSPNLLEEVVPPCQRQGLAITISPNLWRQYTVQSGILIENSSSEKDFPRNAGVTPSAQTVFRLAIG